MGYQNIWEVTVNEVVPVPSEARGRAEENTNRTMQHTNTNIDIAAILQQLTQQITEQRAENNKQLSQLTQQMTKQLAENTRQLEKRINDVKESIQAVSYTHLVSKMCKAVWNFNLNMEPS